jgi:ribosomal protein S18 acetylase RimI-like enzyme
MNIIIRNSNLEDLSQYTDLLQQTYEFSYTNNEIGLTKKCFSKKVFNTLGTQNYLKSHLINSNIQKTWLSFLDKKLIGSITCIIKNNREAELTGFYVHPKYQQQGIGKKLYDLSLKFSENRDLSLDTYIHNKKTIDIYTKWGWKLDTSRGENGYFTRHWPEWPNGLNIECMYLQLKHK